jgi:hypothetical protein
LHLLLSGPPPLSFCVRHNMISQPPGCVLVLVIGVIALALSTALLWCASLLRPGLPLWRPGSVPVVVALSLFIFFPLLELLHRLEIRLFCGRRKLKVLRIRGFRNHYRVDYEADGEKMSGKWPKDFEQYEH